MKELKSRNYYDVKCDAIPDNKIQQVFGTYTLMNYGADTTGEYSTTTMYKRDDTPVALPAISVDYGGVFIDPGYYISITEDTTYKEVIRAEREEMAELFFTITITNDEPMDFRSVDFTVTGYRYYGDYTQLQGSQPITWMYNAITLNDDQLDAYNAYKYWKQYLGAITPETDVEFNDYIWNTATADPVYNGKILVGNKYVLKVKCRVMVAWNWMYTNQLDPENPDLRRTHVSIDMKQTRSVKMIVHYGVNNFETVDFEYHVDVEGYANYPLRIEGNQYTNIETSISGVPWREYISNQLMNAYQEGKLWLSTKLKGNFMIENDLDINDELLVKDLNNNYISKEVEVEIGHWEDVYGGPNGEDIVDQEWVVDSIEIQERYVLFSIKNIEYVYSGNEFIANVNLLEIGIVDPDISFSVYSYIVIDTSAYATVIETKGSSMVIGEHIDGIVNPDTLQVEDVKGYIPFAITGEAAFDSVDLVDTTFMIAIGASNIMFAIAFIDTVATGFGPVFGFDIEGNLSKSELIPVRFRSSIGYSGFADMYSYIKVDTGFDVHDGFYISTTEAITVDCVDAHPVVNSHGFYVNNPEVICISQIDTNVLFESVFDIQGAITKDTVIDIDISTSLFDFKANRLTKIDKIANANNKATSFLSSIGYSGFATMSKIGERPIDNTYFFNWDILEFLDTPIEMDSENHINGFFEVYLT